MKIKWYCCLVVISIFFYQSSAWSANYYFSKDRIVDGYYYSDVYELNMETGNVRIIFPADNKILYPFVLSDQSKIFFRCNWKICVYDTKIGQLDTLSHLGYIERIDNLQLVPAIDEVYLQINKADAAVDTYSQTLDHINVMVNKNTYESSGKIGTFNRMNSLLSQNGQIQYILQDTTKGIYFSSVKVRQSTMEAGILFAIEGYENLSLNSPPKFLNWNNGYTLIRFISNDSAHFVKCDPENKTSICDLTLPWKSCPYFNAYLSPSGDIVLDNVGNIYIYDGRTAALKQRIKFTLSDNKDAHRLVLFLDGILYYLPEDPAESDAISFDNIQTTDMSIIQSNSDLLSVLMDDLDSCWNKGWIDSQDVYSNLKTKLDEALIQIENDKVETALIILNEFKNELQTQKELHIKDLAWRILSLNSFQIIRRKI